MNKLIAMLAVAAALCLSADNLLAQQDNGGGGGGGGRPGRGFRGGDPAQRQQFMLQRYKEDLGFTNDTEWSAVEPLVTKVMDARRDQMMSMFAGFRRGGQDNGGGNGGGPTDPDRDALKQAVDSGAPAAQIKTLLEKYRASEKAKQAKLEQAQADLKNVLSQKQEAQAVLAGLLN